MAVCFDYHSGRFFYHYKGLISASGLREAGLVSDQGVKLLWVYVHYTDIDDSYEPLWVKTHHADDTVGAKQLCFRLMLPPSHPIGCKYLFATFDQLCVQAASRFYVLQYLEGKRWFNFKRHEIVMSMGSLPPRDTGNLKEPTQEYCFASSTHKEHKEITLRPKCVPRTQASFRSPCDARDGLVSMLLALDDPSRIMIINEV